MEDKATVHQLEVCLLTSTEYRSSHNFWKGGWKRGSRQKKICNKLQKKRKAV